MSSRGIAPTRVKQEVLTKMSCKKLHEPALQTRAGPRADSGACDGRSGSDTNKPDGAMRKLMAVSRLAAMDWRNGSGWKTLLQRHMSGCSRMPETFGSDTGIV
jgi:hypothetical protein